MADGSITFSTALDNKQLERDLRKATNEVESLKRKIEKGGDDKTYLASKLKSAMKAAQDARAEIERLQRSVGVQDGSKELAQHIREAAREAEKLARPLEEKRAERSAIEEQMDRAADAVKKTKDELAELKARADEFAARRDRLALVPETGDKNFDTAIRTARESAASQASDLRRSIAQTEAELTRQKASQDEILQRWETIDGEVKKYEDEIKGANAAVTEMRDHMADMQQAEATLKQHESDAKGLERKWNATDEKVREYQRDLERTKGRATALAQEASQTAPAWQRAAESIRSRFSTAAEGIRNKMAQAASKSVSPWEQFSRRVSGLLKRVFLFGVILKGLNAIKNAIGSMLMQNERFSASVANLKATFNGVLSAIVSAALPALTALVNTLAGVLERIAGLVDSIFGTNLVAGIRGQRQAEGDAIRQANAQKQAAYDAQVAQEQARYEEELAKARERQAKAEEKQAKAAQKLEKAQEKANRQLMAFDEINALSAEDVEDAADAIEDYMDDIEGPDFSSIEAPELENDWTLGDFGDAGMLKGVLDWLDELRDRILHDVAGPFAKIREGLQTIKRGWDELVEGIRTGDLGLVLQGLRDIAVGVVQTIEGTINAFLGWLDEQTGGQFHNIIVGIQEMVTGLSEFIQGVLTGDMPRAVDGLRLIVEGLAQTLRGIVDQVCAFLKDTVDTAFDNLAERFPELKWLLEAARDHAKGVIESVRQFLGSFIDGAKDMIKGGIDIVLGILTGDRDRVLQGLDEFKNGVDRRIQGIVDFARNLLNNAFNSLRQAIDGAFKFLSEKFPAAERLFTALKAKILTILNTLQSTFNGIMNGITGAVRKFVDGLGQIFRGGIDVVVGIATGSGERVREGLKGIVNGFVTIIEGLVDNVVYGLVGFANGVIDSLSVLPGVSIPSIQFSGVSLPRLAQGAVIPPNREFMAVLGDQPRGNNIETPESLMRQVVREETGPLLADAVAALLGGSGGRSGDVVLMVGRKELARETMRGMRELSDTGELGDRSGIVFA